MDLSRKRDRDRLPVRADPYWQTLRKGQSLGFRRGPDSWHARLIKPTGGAQPDERHWHPLGEGLDFDEAKRRAEAWLSQMTGTAARTMVRGSVREALESYLDHLRKLGRAKAAADAEWRFKKYVWDDPLASLKLERATRNDFAEWRERQRPGREARTINRQFRSVKAGLNVALELGHVGNPLAWKLAALADDVEDGDETAVFLTPPQRDALMATADLRTGQFLRGLYLSGGRPHELAAARVEHFDGATLRLAHHKGRPPKLRVRYVTLGTDGVAFFRALAQGRSRDEFLFKPDDERFWVTHLWGRRVRAAIQAHDASVEQDSDRLPPNASAYSFRHTRISELLQVYNVDPVTVATQTGTSVAMIEKTYFKFIPGAMQAKLAAIQESRAT